MRYPTTILLPVSVAIGLLLALGNPLPVRPQEQAASSKGRPWTLPEALTQLAEQPHDVYLQYVALQLARRDGRLEQLAPKLDRWMGTIPRRQDNRELTLDLFRRGADTEALQARLQRDVLLGDTPPRNRAQARRERRRRAAAEQQRQERVPLADLAGPDLPAERGLEETAGRQAARAVAVGPLRAGGFLLRRVPLSG
jgi:hypothetical protein